MSQRATLPRTIACVSPPTGIWSSSRTMCTRPARPSTGSWLATYLPRPGQPLRQTGVEAAGHWILADAERRDERPHLRFAALAARGGVGPTMPSSVSPNLAKSGRHALKAERHDLSTRPELGMRVRLIMEI